MASPNIHSNRPRIPMRPKREVKLESRVSNSVRLTELSREQLPPNNMNRRLATDAPVGADVEAATPDAVDVATIVVLTAVDAQSNALTPKGIGVTRRGERTIRSVCRAGRNQAIPVLQDPSILCLSSRT